MLKLVYKERLDTVLLSSALTDLPSRHFFGVFVQLVDVSREGLEVWNNKLLPEGLGEQNDVALDTSEAGKRNI